jgi:hypothetical protein
MKNEKIIIFLNLFMIFIKVDFGFKKFNYFKNVNKIQQKPLKELK